MRVITGKVRGKRLLTPQGMHTRPTTDRLKETIFNIIQFDIEGRNVLDLFSGSGQMGIEALSRGAKSCLFCDNDKNALEITRKNVALCGFDEISQLVMGDGNHLVSRQNKGAFGLIFLDPPYGGDLLWNSLKKIMEFDILLPGGIIVCEDSGEGELPAPTPPYRLLKEYKYRSQRVSTWTR